MGRWLGPGPRRSWRGGAGRRWGGWRAWPGGDAGAGGGVGGVGGGGAVCDGRVAGAGAAAVGWGAVSIGVLLVDDQPLLRLGFRMVLEAQPGLVVVGEAGDGAE